MIANFNEDTSGSEYQSSSMIQRTSRGTESRGSEISRSRGSQKIGDGENFK